MSGIGTAGVPLEDRDRTKSGMRETEDCRVGTFLVPTVVRVLQAVFSERILP